MENDHDYISQMVEDTFEGVKEESSNVLEFKAREQASSIEPEQLAFDFDTYKGSFDPNRNCLILINEDKTIEVPVNWGPFKLYDFTELNTIVSIEKHEDVDLFLDVLSDFMGMEVDSLCISKHENELFFKINPSQVQVIAA